MELKESIEKLSPKDGDILVVKNCQLDPDAFSSLDKLFKRRDINVAVLEIPEKGTITLDEKQEPRQLDLSKIPRRVHHYHPNDFLMTKEDAQIIKEALAFIIENLNMVPTIKIVENSDILLEKLRKDSL